MLNFTKNTAVNGLADLTIAVEGDNTLVTAADDIIRLLGVTEGIGEDDFLF